MSGDECECWLCTARRDPTKAFMIEAAYASIIKAGEEAWAKIAEIVEVPDGVPAAIGCVDTIHRALASHLIAAGADAHDYMTTCVAIWNAENDYQRQRDTGAVN